MAHPSKGADEPSLNALAQRWLRVVAAAGYVPVRRGKAVTALRALLQTMVTAVAAEPEPELEQGLWVGARLVELRMADPQVLGASARLLTDRLPELIDGDRGAVRDRVLRLLEQMINGFGSALRDTTMSAAEDMNRSMNIAWHRERTRLQDELQHTRLHDAVTRLPNRVYLREQLRADITTARPGQRLGVCLLRIDDFCDLNDALGHGRGDEVLDAVGRGLRELVRDWASAATARLDPCNSVDRYFLAHLGGEQFAVVVTGTQGMEEMIKVADQVCRALRTVPRPSVDGYDLRVQISAGIVEDTAASRAEPDDWLRDAHLALAWAGKDHRGWAVFDQAHAQTDVTRHRLAAAMPAALERGEFEPFFQPLLTLADRRIVAVEALARWRRPTMGVLEPRHFITPAETTGLIRPLGRTLLEQALRRGGAWRARGHDLLISVNLSPRQLDDPDLIAVVMEALDRAGLPAERLQLEITESADVEEHQAVLEQLAERDIRLALDDYGTGYSNLASLSRLPVTMVKLAAKLITDLDNDNGDDAAAVAVVRHIIQLCHALNITVTAEGIETETQYLRLRDLGCDYGQGYLFARPGPAGVINRLLKLDAAPR